VSPQAAVSVEQVLDIKSVPEWQYYDDFSNKKINVKN